MHLACPANVGEAPHPQRVQDNAQAAFAVSRIYISIALALVLYCSPRRFDRIIGGSRNVFVTFLEANLMRTVFDDACVHVAFTVRIPIIYVVLVAM